ncbi:SCP-like protein [Ancylostoma caninum]|uniref:SCP-like protein n=1 Tax=Ancylostoma caninum TaxID=29170 RepID=A0A368GY24_ANCCA|nr:SCP-like protein [Ancylostoma caninum]
MEGVVAKKEEEITSFPAFSCSNPGLSDELRDLFLSYHNDARRRVALGIEPNKVGTLNPAKNMYKLEWDCDMEQQAQNAITSCPNSMTPFPKMAQNLLRYRNTVGLSNPGAKIKSTLNNWWSEAKEYGVTDPQNMNTDGNLNEFAQMVYSETTKLGCAYNICNKTMTITCLYNEISYIGYPMWETGPACTQASDCTTYSNSSCDDGLCTRGTDIPDTNNVCPANSGMTDAARQKFLEKHNNYRSRLARGLEHDARGGNAPKAARMLKMVYDCSLEVSAMAHASRCIDEHSDKSLRPLVGENVYMVGVVDVDKVKAAAEASKVWWDELAKYGVGPSNNFTDSLWYSPEVKIGHYTQMAWDTTYRLGCGVAHCPNMTLTVCHYAPQGNYIDELIYKIGDPCTSDSGCPGSYTCSVAEGLCNVV